jgi:hypothetical protein
MAALRRGMHVPLLLLAAFLAVARHVSASLRVPESLDTLESADSPSLGLKVDTKHKHGGLELKARAKGIIAADHCTSIGVARGAMIDGSK